MPWMQAYCGLSGLLNALLACGLLIHWKRRSDPVYLLIGALAGLKIAVEISLEGALFTTTAWASVPEAHAVGMVTGLLLGILLIVVFFTLRHAKQSQQFRTEEPDSSRDWNNSCTYCIKVIKSKPWIIW